MDTKNENTLLSIGALSRFCGIPVETLRNWERRYGFPVPNRRDSGHRRYAWHVASRLKLIRKALDLGYRPSFAVLASEEKLAEVLESGSAAAPEGREASDERANTALCSSEISTWLEHTAGFDAVALERSFRSAWSHCGADEFVLKLAIPFLREVGDKWEESSFAVAHEHFASEVLEAFLSEQWRHLARTARGPKVVLANLEGELHSLPLHMAAVFLSIDGFRILFLGPNTPRADIVAASSLSGCLAAVIGSSSAAEPQRVADELRALRDELAAPIIVLVGGAPRLSPIPGVVEMDTLDAFHDWVDTLAAAAGGR